MGNAFFQVDTFIPKEWKTLASKMHPEGRVPQPQVSASWDHNVDGKFNPSLENFFSTSSQVSALLSNVIVCVPMYSSLPNSCRTVSNKRTGWEVFSKIINAQDLINAQAINKTNMTYKVKKRTGWEIFLKLINAQCLISSHRAHFFLKKK